VGDPSYRTVKGILAVGADQTPPPATDTASAVTPAHLHGPDRLFAHLGKNDDTRDDANDDGDEAVGA
jgi:hypothetical protein